MKLTSENVEKIFFDCLFKDGENTDKATQVEGITNNFGFNPESLRSHANDILSMLHELPDTFMQDKGGGWTFLNACNDSKGEQWTGMHQIMEQLFVLGLAIEKVKCLLPRNIWPALPGGMPYYVVLK